VSAAPAGAVGPIKSERPIPARRSTIGRCEQSVRAAVMPHLIQPGAGEHSTYRSAAGLGDQADQPDEVWKVGAVNTGGTRPAVRPASTVVGRRHRQITTSGERSMLSSSRQDPQTAHRRVPAATTRGARKRRNTRARRGRAGDVAVGLHSPPTSSALTSSLYSGSPTTLPPRQCARSGTPSPYCVILPSAPPSRFGLTSRLAQCTCEQLAGGLGRRRPSGRFSSSPRTLVDAVADGADLGEVFLVGRSARSDQDG
jgi:hypothetical protein